MPFSTSNSNSIPHESSPNTPATTLVTSPSTPSTRFTSKVVEVDHSKQFTSTTPTSLGISNVNVKQNRHQPKMEYIEPLHLPQTQVKLEGQHVNYAPRAEAMGKPFKTIKQEPHSQVPVASLPAPTGQPINDEAVLVNPLGDAILPHPHLVQAIIYVNMYPSDLSEGALADAMPGCLPIRVKIEPAVPPEVRLLPDMHYDWMSKTGTIEFTSIPLAERALAILVNHATFTPRGVWFSPYPPPYILPHPNPPTAARYIRPTKLVLPPILPPKPRPEDAFRANFPTPAEVYDAVRPWGSLRSVNSYITEAAEETSIKDEERENDYRHQWIARVEFWNEEEAKKFDIGFGKTASLLKGWQIFIHAAPLETSHPAITTNYLVPPRMMQQSHPPVQLPSDLTAANIQYVDPSGDSAIQGISAQPTGIMYIPDGSFPPTPASTTLSFFPGIGYDQLPPTPSPINYIPPWAEHNVFAAAGMTPDGMMPMTPDMTGRRMSRSSMGSLHGRPRTWSLTVGESPDGELKPTGLVADDGTIIQHGPGQHIRPAPIHGPGSNSVSGLVDYSNVFIKNLDPDINSYYLGEVFSNVGQVVSARVMRDDQGRSKGYGFVSFFSPEQAANAIARLHDQKLGRSTISVTLHEPRKLRPEKIAERVAHGLPVAYGRQSSSLPRRSMSPVRTDRVGRGRQPYVEEPRAPGTTDEIRSLSPTSRKLALAKRIVSRVRDHARTNSISATLVEPTIKALAKQDLALIPLLHDKPQLDIRIAECFSTILTESLESSVSSRTRTPKVEVERPTNEDLIKLRDEVGKIDPINVNAIVPIMLEMLSPSDWETIWTHSRVAKKYGLAKQILDKKEEGNPALNVEEVEPATKLDAPLNEEETEDLVPLEGLTIPSLCALPAEQIINNLRSENGLKIFSILGVIEPSSLEKANNAKWVEKMMSKSKVERGVELASVLGKKVDIDTLKRSQKLKMIKGLINAEDERALCELILYPALLNAKVKSFVESQESK